jgi:integrase
MAIKPIKPYPTFPLSPHASGWVKKIKGRVVWVCGHLPPDEALKVWHARAPELTGEAPPSKFPKTGRLLFRQLVNRWLVERKADRDAGLVTAGRYATVRRDVRIALKYIGADVRVNDLTPQHFSGELRRGFLRQGWGRSRLRYAVKTILQLLAHADDEDWIDQPVKVGKRFKMLGRKSKGQAEGDESPVHRLFEPDEIRAILTRIDAKLKKLSEPTATGKRDMLPTAQLRAGVLLALNGGYGAADLGPLTWEMVDLENGLIDYRRGKTKQFRIVPLWSQTVEALKQIRDARPDSPAVFLTREGKPWVWEHVKDKPNGSSSVTRHDNFGQAFGKLLRAMEIKRAGVSFYALRHTHRTHSDNAGDQNASDLLMGHSFAGSKRAYLFMTETDEGRQRIRKVVDYIHAALVSEHPTDRRSGPGKIRRAKKPAKAVESRDAPPAPLH